MAETTAGNAPQTRMSRQRLKTRSRLIDAALTVMAHKGADAATINDITETADVGFGSFYNHFSSKEEILGAATVVLFERLGERIDRVIDRLEDPSLALATALRLFIRIIIEKREWAQFIVRVSMVPGYKQVGLYPRLFRDIHRVAASGRVRVPDLDTATYAAGGAVLFLVVALLEGDLPQEAAPERIAATVLRMLGVTEDEIARLVSQPMPALAEDDRA